MAAESSKCGEAEAVDVAKLIEGSLYQGIMNSGAQSYLANHLLYPGKSEFFACKYTDSHLAAARRQRNFDHRW
ncbi:hypothetical protein Nepgr_003498 [Nepenthes gracilis]|uniref:Uncharacterized protein n=1 Tax=Nepenthes gracilis TaxID=150966 RepID=A0AAD3RZL8_NEPGR|nr:hypothetical protein Nepgr_003498 [Nepenthes gracilis]